VTGPLLRVEGLRKVYRARGREPVVAVDGVGFELAPGEVLGLVGESGCGKSTTARCLVRLVRPDAGTVTFDGVDVLRARGAELARFRREVGMVFQDPYSSLNPRMTVADLVGEGLLVHGVERSRRARRARVAELLGLVGLDEEHLDRRARSFSGGQRQRIAIARALAVSPRLLVCDEPVSSLDVSVQAQVLNLLQDMQERLGLAVLFIAHDLAVVRHLCDRVAVMYQGAIVEHGTRQQIYGAPTHPYTRSLLAAIPVPDPVVERARRSAVPAP
jgi:ABC-type oligopeptide transport system ATPase subunit